MENAEDDEERGWQELLEHRVNTKDTVIGIAASGTTPYVIGALRKAREQGILTASISSNPDSPMAMEADIAIEMIVGPECHWQCPYEIRHGAENDPEHDLHLRYDPIG